MRVLLCTTDKIGSRIIRAVTWSRWSHAAIIDGNEIIEAVWPRVRVSSLAWAIETHPRWTVIDIPVADESAAIAAARSQIGKPYDLWGVLGLGLKRQWQDDDAWWCSELIPWAAKQGGTDLFRPDALRRITPEHLWMLPIP